MLILGLRPESGLLLQSTAARGPFMVTGSRDDPPLQAVPAHPSRLLARREGPPAPDTLLPLNHGGATQILGRNASAVPQIQCDQVQIQARIRA